ncbi:uncharacterized protein [Macrobrachium rosenbergii]|uniref:uncharacterized protein isoform X2 n=1 Tax=Macrobrachium rosenbergii TaxID=79674 RepID=UPI0034D4B62D
MGAAQSTRKITLVEDDKAGVIKLSETLAQRLRGQIEGQQAAAAAAAAAAVAAQKAEQETAQQEPLHVSPPPPPQAPILPTPPPSFIEKPLPISPEPPKVPEVVPIPEPPKVPDVTPLPEPPKVSAAPEPVVQEPPEPLVSEPPAFLATQSAPIESVGQVPVPVVPPVALVEEAVPTQILPEAPSPPDVSVAVRAGPSPTLTQPAGNIPPWSIYAEEAHLMVMRLREEKEQEIKKLNQDWRDKLDAREKEFIKMARLSEDQVASTLKEVEGLFMKASCSPVCQNHQDAVMHCYQDHPRQSLRCAREVEQFAQCVDLSRLQSVMKQEAH